MPLDKEVYLTDEQCRRAQEEFQRGERTVESLAKTEHVLMFGEAVVIHKVTDNGGIWHTLEIADGCTKCN